MPHDHYIEALESLRERPELARERTTRNALRVAIASLRAQPAAATVPGDERKPDKAFALMLLDAAAKSGDPAAIALAAQLAAAAPCKTCGFVNYRCRCAALAAPAAPIPMVLHCPACGAQHIDACEDAECDGEVVQSAGWSNPPHCSHLCHGCGHIWRPADVPTTGVAAVQTKGANDSPIAATAAPQEQPSDDGALTQALKERDDAEDMADQLAAQIAAITGEEIGEHSSANDPWHNAMLAADEFIAVQIRNLFSPPTAPKEFDADDMQEQWNAGFAAGRAAPQAGEDAQPVKSCPYPTECFDHAVGRMCADCLGNPQPAPQAASQEPK